MQFESLAIVRLVLDKFGVQYKEETKSKSVVFSGKTGQNRKELLASMVFALRQVGISASHLKKSSHSSSSGHIETDDGIYIVLKPTVGATETLKINGSKLTEHGTDQYLVNALNPENSIKVRSFSSAKQIEDSIMAHLYGNPDVSEAIESTFRNYFASGDYSKIQWNPLVEQYEKNELAKHIGEPLLGYIAFKEKDWGAITGTTFLEFPIKSFKVPNQSNHSEIDSVFVDRFDHIHHISNKVTRGARASFFTNILPILDKVNSSNLNEPLRQLLYTSRSVVNPERNGKQIVYRFGLNYVLGMNLNNPYKVFSDISSKVESKELKEVVARIKRYLRNESRPYKDVVLSRLDAEHGYSSLTVFLCQEITRLLNEPETNNLLVKFISGKNFYQASLNTNMWNNGEVFYSIIQSGRLNLRIVGDKSSFGDIHAGHGLLNYALTSS
jgi:hypothetical protein